MNVNPVPAPNDGEQTARRGGRQAAADTQGSARAGLKVFFPALVLLTALTQGMAIATKQPVWLALTMWAPATASLVARLVRREGVFDVSFRVGGPRGWRTVALGAAYPIAVSLMAYGAGWSSHLVGFSMPSSLGGITLPHGMAPAARLFLAVAVISVVGGLVNVVAVLGEELGWRGYMLTRLIDAGTPRPVLVSGLIWAVWHLPVIFGGVYLQAGSGPVSAVAGLFVVQVVVLGYVVARLRLRSGSVWPAVAVHAVWNAVIQAVLDKAVTGSHVWLWVGEQGLFMLVFNLLGALVICRGRWTMLRRPARREDGPLGAPLAEPVAAA